MGNSVIFQLCDDTGLFGAAMTVTVADCCFSSSSVGSFVLSILIPSALVQINPYKAQLRYFPLLFQESGKYAQYHLPELVRQTGGQSFNA